jgi:hypothetical protein
VGVQPSASRTDLLLACPRPFDPEVEADPDFSGEAARYGSAFHQVIAACLSTAKGKRPLEKTAAYTREVDRAASAFDVKSAAHELAGHVKGSVKVFRNWLEREKLKVAKVERAFAIKPRANGTWSAREISLPDEDHHYDNLAEGEVPGTVDVIAMSANRRRAAVIDHKTGSGNSDAFARPPTIPQMRTLGLALEGKAQPELGIFHADRRGLPALYAEPYEPLDQKSHAVALHRALSRIGSGFLRTGPQCEYCKAKTTCPAKAAELLGESTTVLVESATTLAADPIDPKGLLAPREDGLTVEERAGALYDLLKRFKRLEKAASAEIKRLVKDGAVIETRDGKVLTIQRYFAESVSKKSIVAAFGHAKAEKELRRLRAAGALFESPREKVVPK